MTPTEFRTRTIALEKQIAFNQSIHCTLVAARYQRQLEVLKKEYEAQPSEAKPSEATAKNQ